MFDLHRGYSLIKQAFMHALISIHESFSHIMIPLNPLVSFRHTGPNCINKPLLNIS